VFSAAAGLIYVSYFGRVLRWEILLRPYDRGRATAAVQGHAIGFTAVVLFGRPVR